MLGNMLNDLAAYKNKLPFESKTKTAKRNNSKLNKSNPNQKHTNEQKPKTIVR